MCRHKALFQLERMPAAAGSRADGPLQPSGPPRWGGRLACRAMKPRRAAGALVPAILGSGRAGAQQLRARCGSWPRFGC